MIPYFSYELAAIPTSLLRDSAMRKKQKSQLAKALTNEVQLLAERNARAICVIDRVCVYKVWTA